MRSDRPSAVAAALLVSWGVLSFGAVYPWAYWPLFAFSSVVGLTTIVRGRAWRDDRLRRIGLALLVVALAVGFQALSLSQWLVDALSPGTQAFHSAFQVGYRPGPRATLSIAPGATIGALGELAALSLLLLGLTRTLGPSGTAWLAGHVVWLGLALAVFGIVQRAFLNPLDPAIYGFWRPGPGASPFGPFVNRNHFAGWMVMAVPVVAAYAWSQALLHVRGTGVAGSWGRRLGSVEGNRLSLVGSSVFIMAASVLVTGSRSGTVSLLVALGLLAIFVARAASGRSRWIGAVALVLVLAAAVVWAGGPVLDRFTRASTEVQGRLGAWRDTLHIVGDFPITGTGLGTYGRAMLLYQTGPRRAIYAQAHNDYLQFLAEGGLLVVFPAIVALGLIAGGIVRRLRQGDEDLVVFWVRRGAVAGLAGILAQSTVDFSLQMPGNAVMCVVLLALALERPRPVTHAHRL